jgi:GxGYxY sequence motif in domain of unknown function N-terminal/GxGYxYP putative glycoside hydrolase C-terminal domain
MPAAAKAYVVDCQKDNEEARTTAWALQGLVNQTSAEVYVLSAPGQMEQLEFSQKPYEMLTPLSGSDTGLRTLFQKYQGRVKKMFVYEPDIDWTRYLALMAGAQQNGIAVTESVKESLISEFGWKGEVEDFRGRWTNGIAAYDWALANLMPNCNKQVIFTPKSDRAVIEYAVATKGFTFWLDFKKQDEATEVKKIFGTPGYTVGTSLMGYASDGDAANDISNPFGIGYVVSAHYANGSFWSSFPDKTYTQSTGQAVEAMPGKVYVCLMWSDGDNVAFDQNQIFTLWHDPARGAVPVATLLSPTLQELNPTLLDWYYTKKSDNDELIAGSVGLQFISVTGFKDDLFPQWCQLLHDWCRDAGFHFAHTWLSYQSNAKDLLYGKTCGLTGIYGESTQTQPGLPPIIGCYRINGVGDFLGRISDIGKPNSQAPVFVSFLLGAESFNKDAKGNGYLAIERQVNRLEAAYPGRYVFQLPKDQFATMQAYYHLLPGP